MLHNQSHDSVAQKNEGAINILGVLGSFRLKSLKWFNEAKNMKKRFATPHFLTSHHASLS